MALTNRAALKIFLGIDDDAQDDLLDQLIAGASAAISKVCQRIFESATYTHYFSGTGTSRFRLYQFPVTSITSLYLDATGFFGKGTNAFASGTLLTEGADYVGWYDASGTQSDRGMVIRLGGIGYGSSASAFARGEDEDWQFSMRRRGTLSARQQAIWPGGKGNIKVTYVAGFTTIPADLAMACNELVAWVRKGRKFGGPPTSESYEEYSYSLQSPEAGQWPVSVTKVIDRYRVMPL